MDLTGLSKNLNLQMKKPVFFIVIVIAIVAGCNSAAPDENKNLDYCIVQAGKAIATLPTDSSRIPRSITNGKTEWRFVNYRDWTCGFWPGILWYAYEYTNDDKWKQQAQR